MAAVLVSIIGTCSDALKEEREGVQRRSLSFAGFDVGGYEIPSGIPALVEVTLFPNKEESSRFQQDGPRVTYPMAEYLRCKGPCLVDGDEPSLLEDILSQGL